MKLNFHSCSVNISLDSISIVEALSGFFSLYKEINILCDHPTAGILFRSSTSSIKNQQKKMFLEVK